MKKYRKYFIILGIVILGGLIFLLFDNSNRKILKYDEKEVSDRLTQTFIKNNTYSAIRSSEIIKYDENGEEVYRSGGEIDFKDGSVTLKELNEEKRGEEFASNLEDIINKKKFDELYSYFSEDYLKDFNIKLDDINFEYTFEGVIKAEYLSYEKNSDYENIRVKFTEKSTNAMKIKDFTLDSNGKIIDKEIESISDKNEEYIVDDVSYKLNKIYISEGESYFLFTILNDSEYLLDIKDLFILNDEVVGLYEVYSYPSDLIFYPGLERNIILKVSGIDDLDYLKIFYENLEGEIKEKVVINEN